ncbi:hypothetical protein Nepgr_015001 [Nepenthes gracilis]|uniref:CW-type domain-containing protein n=1 Tax=Nepenthes gracilis TaxID=150966 RepID=A0AAD3SKA9_NEPGR|nr:hypothetical protein Nepgr_015001 [Nepenthes gracilis]
MREAELEEGQASRYSDNDENGIDPDNDLAYLDKRIHDLLGQYQRDFMGGFSAEQLGARYGGYGSFLPAYRRSPTTLSHLRVQSNSRTRPSHIMLPEAAPHNPVIQANDSLHGRHRTSSDCGVPTCSVPVASSTDIHTGHQSSEECIVNLKHKNKPDNSSTHNSQKVQVREGSHNILAQDNSAIYCGLGLDMSPSSSPEDSPLEFDRIFPSMLEGSPFHIVEEIMTSLSVPDGKLLSPLRGSFVGLMEYESNLVNGRPDPDQALSDSVVHGSSFPSQINSEVIKEGKGKLKDGNEKVIELKKNYQDVVDASGPRSKRREAGETLTGKETVSQIPSDALDINSEGYDLAGVMGKVSVSKHSFASNEKSGVGRIEKVVNHSLKEGQVAKHKAKEPAGDSVSSKEAATEQLTIRSTKKAQRDERVSSLPRKDAGATETNEAKSLKERGLVNNSEKDEVLDSLSFHEAGINDERKAAMEKIQTDQKARTVLKIDAEGNGKRHKVNCGVSQGVKYPNSGSVEPLEANFDPKSVFQMQMEAEAPRGKEHSFSASKKKKTIQPDGRSTVEVPNMSSRVGSSAVQIEKTPKSNFPSKNKRDNMELHKELQNSKDSSSAVAGETNFSKKEKLITVNNSMLGVSEGETNSSSGKLKEKPGGKEPDFPSNIGSNVRGDLRNDKFLTEMASNSGAPQAGSGVVYEADNWVQCDRCHKWRLLPCGINPDSLPKKWVCRMLNWLPGMNKCSLSEDDTTNALLALYQVPVPEMQNIQPGAAVASSAGAYHDNIPSQLIGVESVARDGKKGCLEIHDNSKDNRHSVEFGNLNKLSHSSIDLNSVRKNGDSKSLKVERKRDADQGTSGVPKKVKTAPQQFMEDPSLAGVLAIDNRDDEDHLNLSSSDVSKDFAQGRSLVSLQKFKDKAQKPDTEEHIEDASVKKRKLKDQHNSVMRTESPHWVEQNSLVNQDVENTVAVKEVNSGSEQMKESKKKKSKGLDFQEKKPSASRLKGKNNTAGHGGNSADDNSFYKDDRLEDFPLGQHHWSNISLKALEGMKSSQRDLESGFPVVAPTSNSSNISGTYKLKLKPHEVKCSPVGSISSSPVRVLRSESSDYDGDGNKVIYSHNEPEELFSLKGQKCGPQDGQTSNGKSKTQINSVMSDPVDEDLKKLSSAEHPSNHGREKQPKIEVYKDARGKLDSIFEDKEIAKSHHNLASNDLVARPLNWIDSGKAIAGDAATETAKSNCRPQSGSRRENSSRPSRFAFNLEKGDGLEAMDLPKELTDGGGPDGDGRLNHVNVRRPKADLNAAKDIGASSSATKDNSNRAARTALREATDLKHSANRLKITGSGHESTEVFFQAALKFLHGAALLEHGNTESGRCGKMSPVEVYSTTAKLCEYCAREFERCNDMTSAALAYKCMEVAYMRVVYSNDFAASRDRLELQTTLRATPPVESPSSSASDIDNLNNHQGATDAAKELRSPVIAHGNHVISAGNMQHFVRLLDFVQIVNLSMEASRKCQMAFAAALLILPHAGNGEGISSVKRVLDFSFHDVDELIHLVRLAMEAFSG